MILNDVYSYLTATLQYDISFSMTVAHVCPPSSSQLSFSFPEAHTKAESCKDIYIFLVSFSLTFLLVEKYVEIN